MISNIVFVSVFAQVVGLILDIIHYLRMVLEERVHLLKTFKGKKTKKGVILVPVGIDCEVDIV